MNGLKQAKNLFKRGKFQNFQNTRDNKFSVYKYERNIFVGKNNQSNAEDFEFIENLHKESNNADQSVKESEKRKSISEGVDNLCDLWDKLGQEEQQKINVETDSKQKEQRNVQLTEEQLLQCFGEDDEHTQNYSVEQNKENISTQNKVGMQNNNKVECNDDDLMEIWGQNQAQKMSENTQKQVHQSFKNNENERNNNLQRKLEQIYQLKDTPQTFNENQTQSHQPKISNILLQQDDFDCQMQLQDPNNIIMKPLPKKDDKENDYQKKVQQQLLQKTLNGNQKCQEKVQTKQPQTLSIINEIILENNNKNMIKLIPRKDYRIFDSKAFALSAFKQNTYSYFGIQTRKKSIFSEQSKQKQRNLNLDIFYLYSFQAKEDFLELKAQAFQKIYLEFLSAKKTISVGPNEKKVQNVIEYSTDICYKIRVCSTKEHIATLFYKVIKEGYLFDLRLFDQYQNTHSESIALIEVKDGYVNQCCYCDTNVFMEKTSQNFDLKHLSLTGQIGKSHLEKLKMILNIKNGKLTANMGINGIKSSPYNCCLENQQNQKFIYLMGLLLENVCEQIHTGQDKQFSSTLSTKILDQENKKIGRQFNEISKKKDRKNKFIVKIGGGISPLLGLAIAAGRKIYIDSFE